MTAKPARPANPADQARPAQELPGKTLLPLRAFLGFTFCFAGLQKLANPQFLAAGNPASIQAQLAAAARRSPVHVFISPLTHVAVPLGLLIALGELAIGVGTLLGLWARLAALGGLLMSFMLFLTVSFHTSPYYTGSDIVFVFAWTPLLLSGAGSVLSLDAAIAKQAHRGGPPPGRGRRAWEEGASRREVVVKSTMTAVVAAASLITGGLAAGLGRLAGGAKSPADTATLGGQQPAAPAPASPASSGGSQAGRLIGPASDVPVGGAASFQDPGSGDPAIVIRPSANTFLAFDAVCPHAGCTVEYDPSAKVIVCPCHGSQFNAATGAVEVGPAVSGLTPVKITESGNGKLYAV